MALAADFASFDRLTHRLVASRWPTVGVFDDLVDPEDAEAAMELEGATNDRLTGALGRSLCRPVIPTDIGSPFPKLPAKPLTAI